MGMHGSPSTSGVGELRVILYQILEVDGRTMVHSFIFEAVIITSMGLDVNRVWSVLLVLIYTTYVLGDLILYI